MSVLISGCQSAQQPQRLKISEEDRQAFRTYNSIRPGALPVAEGALPLYLLVRGPGTLSVAVKDDANALVRVPVGAGQALARVEEKKGVWVGKENVLPGPLPAGRTYQLFWVGNK